MLKRQTVYTALLRSKVGGKRFTIVSNNCWGAHVYQDLGIAYETPFVGLFVDPDSYLNLLSRFRSVIQSPLTFARASQHPAVNTYRREQGGEYPIGKLADDIEIQFLHCKTEAEAAVAAAKTALEGEDAEALKQANERLTQVAMKMGEAMYKSQSEATAAGEAAGAAGSTAQDEKVVDAEFEEVDEKKKKAS